MRGPAGEQSVRNDMMPMKPRTKSEWSQGQDLYHILTLFAEAEAQDDHDKIYALLGMCTGGKGQGGAYSRLQQGH
jgi:hypothetical protein